MDTALRYIRPRDIASVSGVSKSHAYALMRQGKFPPLVKLSDSISVWRSDDVQAWIEQTTAASRAVSK